MNRPTILHCATPRNRREPLAIGALLIGFVCGAAAMFGAMRLLEQ